MSLELQLPQDHPIAAVDALEMPGWTSKVQTRHLTTPVKTDDGSFSDVASVITWTGGKISPGHYGEFKVLAMGLPKDTDSLTFKALQGYDNGQTVAWIETQANADHNALASSLGRRGTLQIRADEAVSVANGSVLARKDRHVLDVDVTGLPATFGKPAMGRDLVAYSVAGIILACWAGDTPS